MHSIDDTGVNPLPDKVGGQLRIGDILRDYVIGSGGRIMQRTAGPIVHWFAVFEEPEVPLRWSGGGDEVRMGLAVYEDTDALFEVAIRFEQPDGPLDVPFTYGANVGDSINLALLLLTRLVRVDFLVLREDGEFDLLETEAVQIPDEMTDRMLPGVIAELSPHQEQPDGLRRLEWAGAMELNPAAEFLAADHAKSAELLASLSLAAAEPGGLGGDTDLSEYAEVRRQLLDALVDRAKALVGRRSADAEDERARRARRAMADVVAARRQGVRDTVDPLKRVAQLVDGLLEDKRAFVHMSFGGGQYLELWLAFMKDGALSVEREDLSPVAMLPVRDALFDDDLVYEQWMDNLLSACSDLGTRLFEVLASREVRRVIFSPSWFAHALPLHALRAPTGRLLLDEFDEISYAPSAGVLRELRTRDRPRGHILASSFHRGDLPLADVEARVLSTLFDDVFVLEPATTTPAALLNAMGAARWAHIACHGRWLLGDYYSSGLLLAGPTDADGLLSTAQIQRDARPPVPELVFLSACESGTGHTEARTRDEYAGIDGAFMAAGVRATVSTLWEVDDLAAVLFTTAFYAAMRENASLEAAYRTAIDYLRFRQFAEAQTDPLGRLLDRVEPTWRRELEEVQRDGIDFGHPFYWAAFKLGGLTATPRD